jgi:hypothetical protein
MCPVLVPPGRKRNINQGSSSATINKNASNGFLGLCILFFPSHSICLSRLLTYELVRLPTPLVENRLTSKGARPVALATLSVLTITLLILLTVEIFACFKSDTGNRQALLDKTNHILTDARTKRRFGLLTICPATTDKLALLRKKRDSGSGCLGRLTIRMARVRYVQ